MIEPEKQGTANGIKHLSGYLNILACTKFGVIRQENNPQRRCLYGAKRNKP